MAMIENRTYDEIEIGESASSEHRLTDRDIALFAAMSGYLKQHPDCAHRDQLKDALSTLEQAVNWLNDNARQDPEQAGAAATPFLRLTGLTVIGWMWVRMSDAAREAQANGEGNHDFNEAKQIAARFFFDKVLPEKEALLADIVDGKDSVMALNDDQWAI